LKATVRRNSRIAADFRRMEISWPAGLAEPLPGQFVMVRAGESTDPLWRRPLGIHDFRRRRRGPSAFLLFQVVGPVTRRLAGAGPGEEIDLLGPLGTGFPLEGKEHWLVAGGRGIAPLFYLARLLGDEGRRARVLIGGCTAGHVLGVKELERMGHRVEVATEDGSLGRCGVVTELLERGLARVGERRRGGLVLSACGPEGMLRSVGAMAARYGTAARLSLDTLMACGQGYCQGCTVNTRGGYRLCCREGPVFNADEVLW